MARLSSSLGAARAMPVKAGLVGASPWEKLRGQIYLGGDDFLARMAKLATEQGKDGAPKRHRQPARPDVQAMLHAVTQTFRFRADAVQNRGHQPASQAWVYLLRRAANLSLLKTAARAGVSPGRISQIQRGIEAEKCVPELAELMQRFNVKA